ALQAEMLAAGEVRVERGLLQRRADRAANGGALLDDVVSCDERRARGGGQGRRGHVDRRGLSGSVGGQGGRDLARLDAQVDALDRVDVLERPNEGPDLYAVLVGHQWLFWCRCHASRSRAPSAARTHGASIATLLARPRTPQRAA